jgi:2-C-methyl-D-erythritol 2,4-cyclodiphosphate synthase
MRVGIGFDSHRFVEGRPLVLGGVVIPHDRGLDGHSDADVLTHAIVDALLGALAFGDIGTHFPDTDPRWRGTDSRVFLREATRLVRDHGHEIANVDATVITESPRLAPFVARMRAALADTMGVDAATVSVKATTAERLGAFGRGEGMAALAVAALEEIDTE